MEGALPMEVKEETKQDGNSTKSALETEVVLEHLFRFLSVPDLCSVRQICRVWNEEAIPHLKKRSRPIRFFYPAVKPSEYERQDNFMACAQSSDHFPCTNLDLFMEVYGLSGDTWDELESAAAWITSLRLSGRGQPALPLETTFNQLNSIEFTPYGPPDPEHVEFFLQVVNNAPNLSTLELQTESGNNSLLHQLSQVKGLQLKHFTLCMCFPLCPKSPEEMKENCDSVLQCLESQRNSLQSLHLTNFCRRVKFASPNFTFPKLEKLSLCWDEKGSVFQDPLQYARTFPKLRSLGLTAVCALCELSKWEQVLWKQKAASSVTCLSLWGLRDPASQQLLLENAPKFLPNITKLEINSLFPIWSDMVVWHVLDLVCAFEKLDQLCVEVTGEVELWKTFTGEREEECRRMAGLAREQLAEFKEQWHRNLEKEPYAALQRLRVMRIKYLKEEGEMMEMVQNRAFPLSESLGLLFSLQMPNLQILHLLREIEMRGPRPLPQWAAEMEKKTRIIFN